MHCDTPRPPDTGGPVIGTPKPGVVDLCPQNPRKLVPGACGCEVGDEDNDGIEDCLELLYHIDAFDWARQLDVYDDAAMRLNSANYTLNEDRDPASVKHGRLVARIGLLPMALSAEPFETPVTLEVRYDFQSAKAVDASAPEPSKSYAPVLFINTTGGPVRTPFDPPVQLCMHKLRDLEYDLLCLAELQIVTLTDATQRKLWSCVDEELISYNARVSFGAPRALAATRAGAHHYCCAHRSTTPKWCAAK